MLVTYAKWGSNPAFCQSIHSKPIFVFTFLSKYDLKKFNPNIGIFETNFEIKNLNLFNLNEKFLIFSGIGNPSNFRRILLKNNFKIEDEIIFADHHNYRKKEIENIISYSKKIGAKIVTTEKDFVKVEQFNLNDINYIDVDVFIKNEEKFKELIKSKIYE